MSKLRKLQADHNAKVAAEERARRIEEEDIQEPIRRKVHELLNHHFSKIPQAAKNVTDRYFTNVSETGSLYMLISITDPSIDYTSYEDFESAMLSSIGRDGIPTWLNNDRCRNLYPTYTIRFTKQLCEAVAKCLASNLERDDPPLFVHHKEAVKSRTMWALYAIEICEAPRKPRERRDILRRPFDRHNPYTFCTHP